MKTSKTTAKRYHDPKWAALIAVLALAAAYGIGSRSLHTGSWQQYFMTLGLLIIGGNRTIHLLKLALHRSMKRV